MNSENFIEFVKNFKHYCWALENKPEITTDFYGGIDDEKNIDIDLQTARFVTNIEKGINYAKVFEIEDGIKKLLCLTETPNKNDEFHLPFPSIFLDVNFTKEELAELGIEIKVDKIIGILVQKGVLVQASDNPNSNGKIYAEKDIQDLQENLAKTNEKIVGKDLNIAILSRVGDEYWFDDFCRNFNMLDEFEGRGYEIKRCRTSDKKANDFAHRFLLNFLNFLNNPEVEYVEHLRSAKNQERRMKAGKPIIPSSMSIKITGKLRQYIDEAMHGEGWNYGYRFWVRGHFRQLQSERYSEKKRI